MACVYDADYGHGACDEDEEAGTCRVLSGNKLSGSIPASVGSMSSLQKM